MLGDCTLFMSCSLKNWSQVLGKVAEMGRCRVRLSFIQWQMCGPFLFDKDFFAVFDDDAY